MADVDDGDSARITRDMKPVRHGDLVPVAVLKKCARCGGDHTDLVFQRLDSPVLGKNGQPLYTHWAPCPTNLQPILNRVVGA